MEDKLGRLLKKIVEYPTFMQSIERHASGTRQEARVTLGLYYNARILEELKKIRLHLMPEEKKILTMFRNICLKK